MSGKGLVIAATSSRSGKSMLTAGLARALKRSGKDIRVAKSGPDYIDPGFHAAATGRPCFNLDGWAMSDERLASLSASDGLLLIEGAMGLFDGAANGQGSSADIAKRLGLPVVLVINCASMSQSVAAMVSGFINHDRDINVCGVILNQVGSDRHEAMLQAALSSIDVPIFGSVRRSAALKRPSRHLGLVQAQEDETLNEFLEKAADTIEASVDVARLIECATPLPLARSSKLLPAIGQHVALARDEAFSFIYPHLLQDWEALGTKISYFSPVHDQPPESEADAIYLPGGYPELYAAKLTRAGTFRAAMTDAAASGKTIYGECGGYMVLGHSITDARDIPHPMLGLLDLETSFRARKLHLGYLEVASQSPPFKGDYRAHEFHYASTVVENGQPLFETNDATGTNRKEIGLVSGTVSGSFAHIIDCA